MGQLDYFPAFYKYRRSLSDLTDDQVGRVFLAALQYAEEGTIPKLGVAEKMAFRFIAADIDLARAKYNARCEKNRQNVQKRWEGEEPNNEAVSDSSPDVCEGIRSYQSNTNDTKRTKQTNKQTNKQTYIPPAGEDARARTRGRKTEQSGTTVGGPDAYRAADGEPVPPTMDEINAYCSEAGLIHVNKQRFFDTYAVSGWIRNGEPIRDWRALLRKWDAEDAQEAAAQPAGKETSFETDSFWEAAVARSDALYQSMIGGNGG